MSIAYPTPLPSPEPADNPNGFPAYPLPYDRTKRLAPGPAPIGWDSLGRDRDGLRHWHDWHDHLSAGRIGGNPPTPPEVAAHWERNEAVLRRFFASQR